MGENAYFFSNESGQRLFGVFHEPEGRDRRTALILCHPLFEEKLWAQRVYVSLARELARRGFSVFRFDAAGNGDSDGNHQEISLDSLRQDLSAAGKELQRLAAPRAIGVLGMRASAVWALRSAVMDEVKFLVLWQPVLNMEAYFQECFRSNLVTQTVIYGEHRMNRQAMIETLRAGGVVSVYGYLLGRQLYESMNGIRIGAADLRGLPTLVVQINEREGVPLREEYLGLTRDTHKASTVLAATGEPFWRETRSYVRHPEALFRATLDWMEGLCPEV